LVRLIFWGRTHGLNLKHKKSFVKRRVGRIFFDPKLLNRDNLRLENF